MAGTLSNEAPPGAGSAAVAEGGADAPRPLFTALSQVQSALDGGAVVLTPNRRLSRAILAALGAERAAAGRGAWLTPPVMPREQWFVQCWERGIDSGRLAPQTLLSHGEERRLWQRIIEEDDGFSMLGPTRAAAQAMEARSRLMQWRLDPGDRALRQQLDLLDDGRRFRSWLQRFDEALRDLQLATKDDMQRQLLDVPELLAGANLLLLEGEEPTPLQRAVLDGTASWGAAVAGEGRAECQPLQPFPDARSELHAIARWCRERCEVDPGGRYAVVLQDMGATREILERLLRREFERLTGRYESLPVNFATGLTLDRVPLVRDALRILSLGAAHCEIEDFTALCASRFLPPFCRDATLLSAVLDDLRALASARIPAAVWRQVAARLSGEDGAPWERVQLRQARERWHRGARPPSAWIEVFRGQLEDWDWPQGRALDSLEHQQLEHWQSALEGLARFDRVLGKLTYDQALALLREQARETLFQPRTADSAVQVLGPLETTGLDFDAIWVAGMNADAWPAQPRPHPFLPRQLQQRLRMPHCDAAWERTRAEERLASWERSARTLCASYLTEIDEAPSRPSPMWERAAEADPEPAAPDPRWLSQRQAIALETVALAPTPVGEGEAPRGTAYALEQQAVCPFQAFAAQRLDADAPGDSWAGITPAERGMMLHHCLHRLFGQLGSSAALEALDAEGLETIVADAVSAARGAVTAQRRSVLGAAPLRLEAERLRKLLWDWLQLELARGEPFEVVERESEYELQLAGLTLRIRVDRVDCLADGKRLVIDYKSGRADSPARWFERPMTRPQLPLYALLEPSADGVAFASLKSGSLGYRGVGARAFCNGITDDLAKASGDLQLTDMAAARDFWLGELQSLARAFLDGDNRVSPVNEEACRRCGRQALCRIDESAGDVA